MENKMKKHKSSQTLLVVYLAMKDKMLNKFNKISKDIR